MVAIVSLRHESSPEKISWGESVKKRFDSCSWSFPLLGVAAGVFSGMASREAEGMYWGDKAACGSSSSDTSILGGINHLKQLEIKHCALLTPLALLGMQFASDVKNNPSEKKISERLFEAAKKCLTLDQIVSLGLGLTGIWYGRKLGICSRNGFDASGHMMLKTVLAIFLAKGLYRMQNASHIRESDKLETLVSGRAEASVVSESSRVRHRLIPLKTGDAFEGSSKERFERAARRNLGPSCLSQASYSKICGKELATHYRSGESSSFQEGVLQTAKRTIADSLKLNPLDPLNKGASQAAGNRVSSTCFSATSAAMAFGDAVLVAKTVGSCHSIPESAAGIAWGFGIAAIGEGVRYLRDRLSSSRQ